MNVQAVEKKNLNISLMKENYALTAIERKNSTRPKNYKNRGLRIALRFLL
jgi:hypothetical protein